MNGKQLINWIKENKLQNCEIKISILLTKGGSEDVEIENKDIETTSSESVGLLCVYDHSFERLEIEEK